MATDDLRWDDCDELAYNDPIACLLCRTSKLNDWAHTTDFTIKALAKKVSLLGGVTAVASVGGVVIQLWRTVHGL